MRTMSWDHRSQPDFTELARLVAEVTGKPVTIREIATETDQYMIEISAGSEFCGACGVEIRERADCHEEDHRNNFCRKCDGDFAHVWPAGSYTPPTRRS